MFILMEIGGIIAVNIIDIDMEDIVERGWLELNQQTRNLIQSNVSIQPIQLWHLWANSLFTKNSYHWRYFDWNGAINYVFWTFEWLKRSVE